MARDVIGGREFRDFSGHAADELSGVPSPTIANRLRTTDAVSISIDVAVGVVVGDGGGELLGLRESGECETIILMFKIE